MKKAVSYLLCCILALTLTVPAYAYDTTPEIDDFVIYNGEFYEFSSSYNSDQFSKIDVEITEALVVRLNELIRTHKITVDSDTLIITKTKSRQKRDIEPGKWKQIAYLDHDIINFISLGVAGLGGNISIRGLKSVVKDAKVAKAAGGSTLGISTMLLVDIIVILNVYNLTSACEDSGHEGAYIHRYGNNNVFMFSEKADIGY